MTSIIDQIAAKRDATRRARTLDLAIPGYDGMLVARYRALPWREFQQFAARLEHDDGIEATVEVLIGSCDEILIRDTDGQLKPIAGELGDGGGPVRYDARLAIALRFDPPESNRQVVAKVFPACDGDDSADLGALDANLLGAHLGKLRRWMEGLDSEIDEGLLGES